jgi:hypothetical protein
MACSRENFTFYFTFTYVKIYSIHCLYAYQITELFRCNCQMSVDSAAQIDLTNFLNFNNVCIISTFYRQDMMMNSPSFWKIFYIYERGDDLYCIYIYVIYVCV